MAGLKAFIIFIVSCWLLYLALQTTNPNLQINFRKITNAQTSISHNKSSLKLNNMGSIKYSITPISDDMADYLKNRSEYSKYLGGKLVIYFTGANCPYARAFQSALENIKRNTTYASEYTFYGIDINYSNTKTFYSNKDAQAYEDFSNACHEFCIINPYKNQIFAIQGVGEEEAQKLGYIFQQMENW